MPERQTELKLVGKFETSRECWDAIVNQNGVISLRVKDGKILQAFYNCPCGCGLPHITSQREIGYSNPTWIITEKDGLVNFEPSVRSTAGCKSHWNLTNGKIVWHEDSGK